MEDDERAVLFRERFHRRKRNRERTVVLPIAPSLSAPPQVDKPFCLESSEGTRVFFGEEGLRVGRDPNMCDLVIGADNISRLHCVLSVVGDDVCVHNHGSNGTFINGKRTDENAVEMLCEGDELSFTAVSPQRYRFSVFSLVGKDLPESFVNRLHRYILGATIGEGSFAVVREAFDRELGRKVAVKILDKANFYSEQAFMSIHTEIEILRSMSHEHIITVHDAFEEGGVLALVMELVEDGDFFDYLVGRGRNPFTEEEARFLFIQLLEAVIYIHARRVVHCDLKPENILVKVNSDEQGTEAAPRLAGCSEESMATRGDRHQSNAKAISPFHVCLKVTDFGVAKYRGEREDSESARVGGTAAYTAPEVLQNLTSPSDLRALTMFSSAVDVWSLGVLLFIMCSGSPPKRPSAGSPVSFYACMRTMSKDCLSLIASMMCVEPEGRITLEEICSHPWLASCTIKGRESLLSSADTMSATLQLSPRYELSPRMSTSDPSAPVPSKFRKMEGSGRAASAGS